MCVLCAMCIVCVVCIVCIHVIIECADEGDTLSLDDILNTSFHVKSYQAEWTASRYTLIHTIYSIH